MTEQVSYGEIYHMGYKDAINDLRQYLQYAYKGGDKLNPETFSFNAGWNAAIDKLVVDSTGWKKKGADSII